MRILLIEDNKKLSASLRRGFEQEGYAVDTSLDGLEGEKRALLNRTDYDLLVLDLTLPGKDGIAITESLRDSGVTTPIIMLTARDTTDDKILGLDTGADDYLIKPFSFGELLSRVRALSRRPREAFAPKLSVGSLTLIPAMQEVHNGKEKIELTLTEFRMLEYFMQRPGEVINRQRIVDHLWDFSFNPLSRTMDVHINNLRNKLEQHDTNAKIETVRGIGYRLAP